MIIQRKPNCVATVVADSISVYGHRLTTFELVYPRIIHAELMTHRAFSRNAQSSRATPVATLIKSVEENPYVPQEWRMAKKGMQPGKKFNKCDSNWLTKQWRIARDNAVESAKAMNQIGAAKEHVNRLLEPFSFIRVLVTATEWQNFFDLRCSPEAQLEIRELAEAMRDCLACSQPVQRVWHLPYVDNPTLVSGLPSQNDFLRSAARCARVSYLKFDGKEPTVEEDIELAQKLIVSRHMTPFEHQAVVDRAGRARFANFTGWMSTRWALECDRIIYGREKSA